jgi:hypothetical protein
MKLWKRRATLVSLVMGLLSAPLAADAVKVKVLSGLVGAEDSKSKELMALSPQAADQVARRDLLTVLQPTGKFTRDRDGNVEGMTLVTWPYQTQYPYVCREDRVTLRYRLEGRFSAKGAWMNIQRQPVGVEAQPLFHVAQLPIPGFVPGSSYPVPLCDARHPNAAATWFAAPSDADAVRAANMFRMAEDELKAARLSPGPCDAHGTDTCRQWILSLDDLSKVESVEPCPSNGDETACYVISFGSVELTIAGTISSSDFERITPTAITAVRAETVVAMFE